MDAKLAAVMAALVMFQSVLALGVGFSWSLVGLLSLQNSLAWTGAGLALLLASVSGAWLLRRALTAERDAVEPRNSGLVAEEPEAAAIPEEPLSHQRYGLPGT
ncbi:MAG TPA: hypothetical protein VKY54_07530 [Kiloniellales bacterium]|nr:hypothetical protein [Kiloniellales bacterium]